MLLSVVVCCLLLLSRRKPGKPASPAKILKNRVWGSVTKLGAKPGSKPTAKVGSKPGSKSTPPEGSDFKKSSASSDFRFALYVFIDSRKCVPYWEIDDFLVFPRFSVVWSSPALKKSEPKDSIRPRWGKKTAGLFCPPKKIFCKSCDSGKLARVSEHPCVLLKCPKTLMWNGCRGFGHLRALDQNAIKSLRLISGTWARKVRI